MKKLYMHTIGCAIAQYVPNKQICYARNVVTRFAKSLRQIKSEQEASHRWRKIQGYQHMSGYGYVLLKID